MKEEIKLEDLYQITKKAYGKTLDLKLQLEFLMKCINDYGEENETDNNRCTGELSDEPN